MRRRASGFVLFLLLPLSAGADDARTLRSYDLVDGAAFFEENFITGELAATLRSCLEDQSRDIPCAQVHVAAGEDVVLVDLCEATGSHPPGLYQLSTSTGSAHFSTWFDSEFMSWACNELGSCGTRLDYTALRNGFGGPWSILLVDYEVGQLAGYYVLRVQGSTTEVLAHEETDLT